MVTLGVYPGVTVAGNGCLVDWPHGFGDNPKLNTMSIRLVFLLYQKTKLKKRLYLGVYSILSIPSIASNSNLKLSHKDYHFVWNHSREQSKNHSKEHQTSTILWLVTHSLTLNRLSSIVFSGSGVTSECFAVSSLSCRQRSCIACWSPPRNHLAFHLGRISSESIQCFISRWF